MQDQSQKLKFRPLFNPKASITDTTAQVSNIIDTLGFNSLTLVLHVGDWSDVDATCTVLVEHGDNSALSDAAAVSDAMLSGGTEAGMAPTFADDNTCCKLGYIGDKRYVRMTLTPIANAGAFFMSGIAVLGNSIAHPQEDQKTT